MPADELVKILFDRWNHLEYILGSSLFGLFLTTTLGVYAVVFRWPKMTEGKNPGISMTLFLLGVATLYALISGYYYFNLTHFYTVALSLVTVAEQTTLPVDTEAFWSLFQAPGVAAVLGEKTAIFLTLLNAAMFPFIFSSCSILGIWLVLKRETQPQGHRYGILAVGFALQGLAFYSGILYPFVRFARGIGIL